TDPGLKTAVSSVTVIVVQTPTAIKVSAPPNNPATVDVGQELQFTAELDDQFGQPFDTPPAATWSVNGGGILSPIGKFTATAPGDWVVTAAAAGKTGTRNIKVVVGAAPRIIAGPTANPNPTVGDVT